MDQCIDHTDRLSRSVSDREGSFTGRHIPFVLHRQSQHDHISVLDPFQSRTAYNAVRAVSGSEHRKDDVFRPFFPGFSLRDRAGSNFGKSDQIGCHHGLHSLIRDPGGFS